MNLQTKSLCPLNGYTCYRTKFWSRKLLFVFLLTMCSVSTLRAYDTCYDGIYYNLDKSSKTASVTYKTDSDRGYSGIVHIPEQIKNLGNTYIVTLIEEDAFSKCSNLTEVSIGKNVTTIGTRAFYECTELEKLTIGENVTTIGYATFARCSSLRNLTFPNSVTKIDGHAFSGCTNLRELIIPNSIKEIGIYAFSDCSRLRSLDLGKGVTEIGSSAFRNCIGLTELTIPNNVTKIGDEAFYGCLRLTDITILDGTDMLIFSNNSDYSPFSQCPLSRLYLGRNFTYSTTASPFNQITTVTIGNSVTEIGDYSFYKCTELSEVPIPDSVTKIGKYAFFNCSGLTELTIPNSVTEIGTYAFSGCSGLTELTIPNSVIEIGCSAFSYCRGVTNLIIGNRVNDIDTDAFIGCTGLSSVASLNPTPPYIFKRTFEYSITFDIILHVPSGSKTAYQQDLYWGAYFKNIEDDIEMAEVEIADAQYTAYVAEFDIDFTEIPRLTAYKVTNATTSYATFEEIANAPKGTAVILCGEPNTYTLYPAQNEVDAIQDNCFYAGGTQKGDGKTIYALGNKNGHVGFYLVKEGVAVPANKGYLVIGPTNEIKRFIPFQRETTSIEAVKEIPVKKEAVIYNLAGQRVAKPTQNGIYIVNGKKVVINK